MQRQKEPSAANTDDRRRIRAVRHDDVRAQLERRLIWLGLGREPATADANAELAQRIARALRRERRAARGRPGSGYDPLRHLLLVRFARLSGHGAAREALLAHPRDVGAPGVRRRNSAASSDRPTADSVFRATAPASSHTGCADGGAAA